MIFSVQRYIEDYLSRRSLSDVDQYAVKIANLYAKRRSELEYDGFLRAMKKIRTVLFKNASSVARADFEKRLLELLDKNFKKKRFDDFPFPGGVREKRALSRKRKTIQRLLLSFKIAVCSRAVDAIWDSRTRGKLKKKPESIAQGLLAVFFRGILENSGLVLREFASGTGFVDVGIVLSNVLHLIEIKILKGKLTGIEQLATYMKQESRNAGFLVVFDVRPPAKKTDLPKVFNLKEGVVRVIVIDVHPTKPSTK